MLIDVGVINPDQLDHALAHQKKKGGFLGAVLVEMDIIADDLLTAFLSRHLGVPAADLSEVTQVAEPAKTALPESVARRYNIIPLENDGHTLTVATADPMNVTMIDDVKAHTGCEIKPLLATARQIRATIRRIYDGQVKPPVAHELPVQDIPQLSQQEQKMNLEDLLEKMEKDGVSVETVSEKTGGADMLNLTNEAGTAPIVKIVNFIIYNAILARASDIHIEVNRLATRIRYRLDGVLHQQPAPPRKYHNAIVSRIKIMAQLDIAERRLPQDGRIKVRIDSREVVLRVSTVPTAYGEKVVMRILETASLKTDLTQVGFEPDTLEHFRKTIFLPHGIVLVTGPTGSGKSTTLYSALSILNKPGTNIVTIEDPVEYALDGINQVQANADIGLTFAVGLRAFLRQDPNIILLGEIRDQETAEIAVKAALTGHLVLSTLHTNDAASSVTRLTNMGVETYLTASTVQGVLAQRLMRRICDQCKEPVVFEWSRLEASGMYVAKPEGAHVSLWHGVGCAACSQTGYKGREAIMEFLVMSDRLRDMVLERAPERAIKEQARAEGMRTLREAAVLKMIAGLTTFEEVLRVTQADNDPGAAAFTG